MDERLTGAPRREFQSFHDFPICLDLDDLDADIAIIGIPHGAAYSIDEISNDQTNVPTHIGRVCERALRDIVEITPKRDVNGISAITAGRIIVNLNGMAVRAGHFDR